jgi:DNA modification methylase
MYGSDVAYLYGEPPKSKVGQHVIPGRCTDTSANGKQAAHPCPRKLAHVEWLVRWWSEPQDIILDPFCGSGTTCVAAKKLGRKYIGIDISEEYCRIARERLEAVDTGVPVKERRKGQMALEFDGKDRC